MLKYVLSRHADKPLVRPRRYLSPYKMHLPSPGGGAPLKAKGPRLRKLHWDATPGLADVENTIWGTVEEGAHMEFDMKDFEDTFSTSRKAAKAKPKAQNPAN